jgi:hypothetical protein
MANNATAAKAATNAAITSITGLINSIDERLNSLIASGRRLLTAMKSPQIKLTPSQIAFFKGELKRLQDEIIRRLCNTDNTVIRGTLVQLLEELRLQLVAMYTNAGQSVPFDIQTVINGGEMNKLCVTAAAPTGSTAAAPTGSTAAPTGSTAAAPTAPTAPTSLTAAAPTGSAAAPTPTTPTTALSSSLTASAGWPETEAAAIAFARGTASPTSRYATGPPRPVELQEGSDNSESDSESGGSTDTTPNAANPYAFLNDINNDTKEKYANYIKGINITNPNAIIESHNYLAGRKKAEQGRKNLESQRAADSEAVRAEAVRAELARAAAARAAGGVADRLSNAAKSAAAAAAAAGGVGNTGVNAARRARVNAARREVIASQGVTQFPTSEKQVIPPEIKEGLSNILRKTISDGQYMKNYNLGDITKDMKNIQNNQTKNISVTKDEIINVKNKLLQFIVKKVAENKQVIPSIFDNINDRKLQYLSYIYYIDSLNVEESSNDVNKNNIAIMLYILKEIGTFNTDETKQSVNTNTSYKNILVKNNVMKPYLTKLNSTKKNFAKYTMKGGRSPNKRVTYKMNNRHTHNKHNKDNKHNKHNKHNKSNKTQNKNKTKSRR